MDQSAFYGVVSAINFTLLGLWWVAVKDRSDLVGESASSRRTAYLVSLQFVIPATVALFAQVAPQEKIVWRIAFAAGGVAGAAAVAMLAQEIRANTTARISPVLFAVLGIPLYLLVLVVSFAPTAVSDIGLTLTPIEVEGLLFSALVFLGVQEAWVVSMTPSGETSVEIM
jgi:cytochrome bd-type quinol oxidase subunit 2